jgi:hypothetical protein
LGGCNFKFSIFDLYIGYIDLRIVLATFLLLDFGLWLIKSGQPFKSGSDALTNALKGRARNRGAFFSEKDPAPNPPWVRRTLKGSALRGLRGARLKNKGLSLKGALKYKGCIALAIKSNMTKGRLLALGRGCLVGSSHKAPKWNFFSSMAGFKRG